MERKYYLFHQPNMEPAMSSEGLNGLSLRTLMRKLDLIVLSGDDHTYTEPIDGDCT